MLEGVCSVLDMLDVLCVRRGVLCDGCVCVLCGVPSYLSPWDASADSHMAAWLNMGQGLT